MSLTRKNSPAIRNQPTLQQKGAILDLDDEGESRRTMVPKALWMSLTIPTLSFRGRQVDHY